MDGLTYWGLDKMAAILADNIFKCIYLNESYIILIQISLKFVPRSPIDNKWALIQLMAWRRTGDKALTWTNANSERRHKYAALGGDELMQESGVEERRNSSGLEI